jgi:hypothetical protein
MSLFVRILVGAIASVWLTAPEASHAFELSHTAQAIRGVDPDSGIVFRSVKFAERVVADVSVGAKQIHAEIDYQKYHLIVRSVAKADGARVALATGDIVAFQKLLAVLPGKIGVEDRNADALSSLVNLVASAPVGATIDLRVSGLTWTPLCSSVGKSGMASFKLRDGSHRDIVRVGPICYAPPALGRCGAGSGPDTAIGLVQRFTQQCLDHDQCCVKTGNRIIGGANVCGNSGTECIPEFTAAAPGFFFAPDCGATAGSWWDTTGATWVLTGGESSGLSRDVTGKVYPPVCRPFSVFGRRSGRTLSLTARNTSNDPRCVREVTVSANYNDCDRASGTFSNSFGSLPWSWTRMSPAPASASAAGLFGGASNDDSWRARR